MAGPLTSDCEQQRLLAEQPARAKAEAYREWLNRWDDLLWAPGRTAGAICICHEDYAVAGS